MYKNQYFNSKFPESFFPIANIEEYSNRIETGIEKCKESKVVICGLCRDIAPILNTVMCRLKATADMFAEAKIVIVENDSIDGTSELLRSFVECDDSIKLVQTTLNDKKYNSNSADSTSLARVAKMSKVRNMYLDAASMYPDYDYVIVIDLDIIGGWSYDGIYNSFGYDDWSGMTANGIMYLKQTSMDSGERKTALKRVFFDTWTFRPLNDPIFRGFKMFDSFYLERSEPPIHILSNFNGLGIYKYDEIMTQQYMPHSLDGTVSCEHVYMNQKITQNGGKVFINPSLITLYSPTCYSGENTNGV